MVYSIPNASLIKSKRKAIEKRKRKTRSPMVTQYMQKKNMLLERKNKVKKGKQKSKYKTTAIGKRKIKAKKQKNSCPLLLLFLRIPTQKKEATIKRATCSLRFPLHLSCFLFWLFLLFSRAWFSGALFLVSFFLLFSSSFFSKGWFTE